MPLTLVLNHQKMPSNRTFWAMTTLLTTLSVGLAAQAETTKARCDIYPQGEDRASLVTPCTFSQRQGFVTIVLEDGTSYALIPSPAEAATYTDQAGRPVGREDGLGDQGVIDRSANRSIDVYWNPAIGSASEPGAQEPAQASVSAQNGTPVTYVTEVSDSRVVVQITEGEFRFQGDLERTSGNLFQGQDDQVRVMYDRDTGRIVVINAVTGDEFYNYFYSEADEGAL